MKDEIIKEHQFTNSIEEVWSAITIQEKISAWFIQADFKAEVGYEYTFRHEDTKIYGKVLTANPVHELAYTWIVGGTEVETTVSWWLEKNEEGTKLRLEHTGISKYPGETAIAMFNSFQDGWQGCIDGLAKYMTA